MTAAARRTSLTVVVGLACVLFVFVGVFWAKGYRMYVIHTGSMQPTLNLGTLVVTKPAAVGYQAGDVITFRHSDTATDVVTHRVVAIAPAGITTKGDANPTPDPWTIRPNQVQGVRWFTVPRAGYLLVFLQQPAGLGAFTTGLLGLILLWGLFFPAQAGKVVQAARRPTSHRASRHRPTPATAATAATAAAPAVPVPLPRARPVPDPAYNRFADRATTIMTPSDVLTLQQLLDA